MQVRLWPVNLSTTITKFDILVKDMPGTLDSKVRGIALDILELSNTVPPMVPVDDGDLQSTGRVEKAAGGWAVVYGGPSQISAVYVDYANQVHDDMRPRKYKRLGSGPKFVEAHYLRRTGVADADLSAALMELVKGFETI